MAYMSNKSFFRRNFAYKVNCFSQTKMRNMLFFSESIYYHVLNSVEQFFALFGDIICIGDIGKISNTKSINREPVMKHPYGNDWNIFDIKTMFRNWIKSHFR